MNQTGFSRQSVLIKTNSHFSFTIKAPTAVGSDKTADPLHFKSIGKQCKHTTISDGTENDLRRKIEPRQRTKCELEISQVPGIAQNGRFGR